MTALMTKSRVRLLRLGLLLGDKHQEDEEEDSELLINSFRSYLGWMIMMAIGRWWKEKKKNHHNHHHHQHHHQRGSGEIASKAKRTRPRRTSRCNWGGRLWTGGLELWGQNSCHLLFSKPSFFTIIAITIEAEGFEPEGWSYEVKVLATFLFQNQLLWVMRSKLLPPSLFQTNYCVSERWPASQGGLERRRTMGSMRRKRSMSSSSSSLFMGRRGLWHDHDHL